MFLFARGVLFLWLTTSMMLSAPFAGKWVLRAIESDGTKLDDPLIREMVRFTLVDDKFDYLLSNFVARTDEKGTFAIVGVGREHFEVDVRVVQQSSTDFGTPPDRKFVRKEIWRMTAAEELQRCLPNDPFGERPKAFAPQKGDGTCLMTFQKRKP